MSIAVFSSKVFQVELNKIYTFGDLKYSSSLETEKQDSEGSKPSTYLKGPGLDSFSIKMMLDSTFGINPRAEWEEWQDIMNAGIAYAFILGSKPLGPNKWLLVKVDPDNFITDNSGNILSLELSLQFDEYVRPGSKEASKSGTKSSSAPGLSSSEEKLLGPEDKSSAKRDNTNMRLMANKEKELGR